MKQIAIEIKSVIRVGVRLLPLAVCAIFLSSCASAPENSGGEEAFKFSVLRYKEPVPAPGWVIDPAQSANPEGAALNIATEMQHGDVDAWLANWDASGRPSLSREQRDALQAKWLALKNGRVSVLGRVVGGADVVVELDVLNPDQKDTKIQLPMKHSNGQWWLTSLDPNSEYLNWENSPNKLVSEMEPANLRNYLKSLQTAH